MSHHHTYYVTSSLRQAQETLSTTLRGSETRHADMQEHILRTYICMYEKAHLCAHTSVMTIVLFIVLRCAMWFHVFTTHVCAHVCSYMYIHLYVWEGPCMRTYICMRKVCEYTYYIHVCTRELIYVHTCVHMCVRIYTYMCAHVCSYMYIYVFTCVFTYVHTNIMSGSSMFLS